MNPDEVDDVAGKSRTILLDMYAKGQLDKNTANLWLSAFPAKDDADDIADDVFNFNTGEDSASQDEEKDVPVKNGPAKKKQKPVGKPLMEVFKEQEEKDASQIRVKAKMLKHREIGVLMVRCIDDIGMQDTLTIGKVYEAKPSFKGESELYELTGDDGVTNGFYKMRFEVVKEEKQAREENQKPTQEFQGFQELIQDEPTWTDEEW